jgi:transcription antitermination factor NusG
MRRDERDAQTWAVLELTRAGERLIEEGKMEEALRRHLKCGDDHRIFIPAVFYPPIRPDDTPIVLSVTEGYVFVATGLPDSSLYALESTPLVRKVLHTRSPNGMRVLMTVPDHSLAELRRGLAKLVASSISAGMPVLVLHGLLAGLEGSVVSDNGETIDVYVEMRSLRLLRRLPKTSVRPVKSTGG